METPIEDYPEFESAFVAYLLAVTSADLTFILLLSFDKLSGHSLVEISIMTVSLFVVGWLFASMTALIPFVLGIVIARRFKVSHWLYFVGGGAFTAAVLCLLAAAIPNLGINVQGDEPSFGQMYLSKLPSFLACGSIAGTVCWGYLRRGFTKQT
jgi:hypothetical protein